MSLKSLTRFGFVARHGSLAAASSMAALSVAAMLGSCADPAGSPPTGSLTAAERPAAAPAVDVAPLAAAHKANPADPATALAFGRALRSAGATADAMAVLDKAAKAKPADRRIALERGLLALELGETGKAETLLRHAHDPKAPDWRLHSALGATLASRGKQQEAQAQFAKALALAPDHPSILNNLAFSYALDSKPDEAEKLLRRAQRGAPKDARDAGKVQQNLALVLGLRGKYDEAGKVAQTALPAPRASENMAYLKRLADARAAGVAPTASVAPAATPSKSGATASLPQPTYQLGAPPEAK